MSWFTQSVLLTETSICSSDTAEFQYGNNPLSCSCKPSMEYISLVSKYLVHQSRKYKYLSRYVLYFYPVTHAVTSWYTQLCSHFTLLILRKIRNYINVNTIVSQLLDNLNKVLVIAYLSLTNDFFCVFCFLYLSGAISCIRQKCLVKQQSLTCIFK